MPRLPVPHRIETRLDEALDRALAVQRPVVLAHLDRVRRRHPKDTPAQVVARLEREYVVAVAGIGGASGAAAAVPGVGTVASLASGAAELAAFVSATAMFVLARAELAALPVSDPDARRALVLAVLTGESGVAALEQAGGRGVRWSEVLTRGSSTDKKRIKVLNGHLGRLVLRRLGTRQGALLAGRALPLGVGAVIGVAGNVGLARRSIAAAARAFGRPPQHFPPGVVDA